jgi:predicted dithiol-disulfide oxidoreductase (DUF899 family)
MADHVPSLAHLNARDTTLAYASRPPQDDIERLKASVWWTWHDSYDAEMPQEYLEQIARPTEGRDGDAA